MARFLFFVSVIFSLMVSNVQAQQCKLDSLLKNIYDNDSIVGFSVTAVKGDSFIYNKGFGLRNVDNNLPVNNNTRFRIASISKTITTLTLMTLYDKGLFSLDDDISKYLGFTLRNPKFPNDTITIRHILSHTSSLNDGVTYDTFLDSTIKGFEIPDVKCLLIPNGKYYSEDMFQNHSPKEGYFRYANINFGIIGTMIEKLTGKRFDIVAKENILLPLGIKGSYNILDLEEINDLAVLYRKSGDEWQPQTDNYLGVKPPIRTNLKTYIIGTNGVLFSPTGGLRVTSKELATILLLLKNLGKYDNKQIISETTINEMLKPVWIYNGNNGNNYGGSMNNYSLGNYSTNNLVPDQLLIGHSGDAYGLISDMYFSAKDNFGIVFICNGGKFKNGINPGWYKIEEDIFNILYNYILEIKTDSDIPKCPVKQ
ncbi:MAG TPA: serine hydrolase domain-containing protein [Melioribacteraceae bacterium]|nr:serine hydrolase domain-containing protein [Melioribacteraceae bacterium]